MSEEKFLAKQHRERVERVGRVRPNTFIDKQSQIAERKTGNGRGPGNHSNEAGKQLGPRPTPLTGRAHVGGGSRGKSPNPTPDT